jgi:hypothetical protein
MKLNLREKWEINKDGGRAGDSEAARSTDNVIAIALHTALSHLDKRNTCSLTIAQYSTP